MIQRIITFSMWSFVGLSLINCPSAYSQVTNLLIDPAINNDAAVLELVTAIKTVRASGVPGTINLFSNGTYTLTQPDNWEYGPNGLPQISGDITINGQGATIQRATNAPKFRFFYVSGGLSSETNTGVGLPAGKLTLNNLTVTGGLAKGGNAAGEAGGGGGMGGAIFNQGTLTMTCVNLIANTAQGGLGGSSVWGPGVGGPGGGGGMGSDGDTNGNGGGFGGPFLGRGGAGSAGATNGSIYDILGYGGGGGGFRPYDNGSDPVGGGLGGLGGAGGYTGGNGDDGGAGGIGSEPYAIGIVALAGGDFGYGGNGSRDGSENCGGGGGVGGGGGHFGFNALEDGFGGFGGGGGGGGVNGGNGGFGGGGGSGDGGGWSIFAGGTASEGDEGGGGGGGLGGAIFNHRGQLFLTNCTITANTAKGGDSDGIFYTPHGTLGGCGYGGGLFNLNGTVILDSCTVSSNIVDRGYYRAWPTLDLFWVAEGDADGGALYNLAFGNKIEDGTESIATVTLVNTVFTNSMAGPLVTLLYTNDSDVTITNAVVPNDLVNNEVDGNQTNTATVVFSGCSTASDHIDLAQAQSISAATGSQAALLTAPAICADPVFQFNVIGVPGYHYIVQASANMTDWVSLQTNVCPFVFEDTSFTNCPARFYRALYQP